MAEDRTAEEREAARLERQRRRAAKRARAGLPPEPPAPAVEVPTEPVDGAREPVDGAVGPVEAAPVDAEPSLDGAPPGAAEEAPVEPAPEEAPAELAPEEAPAAPAPEDTFEEPEEAAEELALEVEHAPAAPAPEDAFEELAPADAPADPEPEDALEEPAPDESAPAPAPEPVAPSAPAAAPPPLPALQPRTGSHRRLPRPHRPVRSRQPPRQPGRHSRRARVLALVALVIAVAIVLFCYELFQPFHSSGHGSVTVSIPAHAHIGQISGDLERDGVISSSFFFEIRATLSGDRGDLRAGTYRLKRDMSYSSVLSILTQVLPAAKVNEVTLIPGRTRRQLDVLLRSQGVAGSYYADTRVSRLLRPYWYGAPRSTDSLEGFLFPDTYQLREPIGIPALVADQLKTFRQQFAGVNFAYARSQHLTPYDVLIIASMVEAEAQTAADRPLVASVIYNRLRKGMPLQIDATTRYATGNYTSPLTVAQLNSSSPYNTRIRPGLPPTPIDSPGLASIKAAASPAHTNDLYFVDKVCGNGALVFSANYQQFQRYEQSYQTARTKRGGRSPANC